jgi:hypothetical protein
LPQAATGPSANRNLRSGSACQPAAPIPDAENVRAPRPSQITGSVDLCSHSKRMLKKSIPPLGPRDSVTPAFQAAENRKAFRVAKGFLAGEFVMRDFGRRRYSARAS